MWRIWHHSEPFPHPTPIKVVQSGTIMFQQDIIVFASEILRSGQNFLRLAFFQVPFYTPLFYCVVSREISILMCSYHKNHIIIIMEKQGTVKGLPPRYFQCTNLTTAA